jgi:hypothetical protein
MLAEAEVGRAANATAAVRRAPGSPAAGPATLVAIASAGHSGSTLLDLLIGNHSKVSSAGEMNRLTLHATDRVCACGATVTSCDHWNRVRGAVAREWAREHPIRWDECHTDIPPQKPLARLQGILPEQLVDGSRVPEQLHRRILEAGLPLGDGATLTRGGVRDFKWRLIDAGASREYVLRGGEAGLEIYSADVKWKNPVRLVPEPLEIALALGSAAALSLARACSPGARRYIEVARNSWAVADAMAAVNDTPFVVDSSKSPLRLKLLYMLRPDRVRVLQLVRDGRAVTASAMRRRDMSAAMAARIWKRDNQNLAIMLGTVPARARLRVRYEALCENPSAEMRRVCDFLGLEFEPGMLALWARPVHNIPGNPMLFERSRREIRKDERWRRDLTADDLNAFERAAGRLNRSFGYR